MNGQESFLAIMDAKQPRDLNSQQSEQAQVRVQSGAQAYQQAYQAPVRAQPTWFDQTVGAAEYGTADVAGLVSSSIGETFHSSAFTDWGRELEQFKVDHPQYAPEEVSSSWDLLTNPKALAGRVSGMAPYVLLTAGAAAGGALAGLAGAPAAVVAGLGFVGPYLSAGLVYSIESERAYKSALEDGATDDEATRAGRISGIVNGGLQLLMVKNLVSFVHSGEANLASSIVRTALGKTGAMEALGPALGFLTKQSLIQATQGGVNELIPLGVYGKPIQEGFIDRRFQDAIGAVAAGEVFGPIGKLLGGERTAVDGEGGTKTVQPQQMVEVDSTSLNGLSKRLQDLGHGGQLADALAAMYHSRANTWAGETGNPVEQFYAKNPIEKIGEPQHGVGKVEGGPTEQTQEGQSKGGQAEGEGPAGSTSGVAQEEGLATMGVLGMGGQEGGGQESSSQESKANSSGLGSEEPIAENHIPSIEKTLTGLWETMKGDLTAEEQQDLNELFPSSKRSKVTQDQKIVRALMRYTWDGTVADSTLLKPMEHMQAWIKEQYGTMKDAGLVGSKLSNGQRAFLDNLLYKDSPTIGQKRVELEVAKQSVLDITKEIKEAGGDAEHLIELESQLDLAKAGVKDSTTSLERLKEGQFHPDTKPEGEGQELLELPAKFGRELPTNRVVRNKIQKASDEFQRYLVSAKNPLMSWEWGRKLVSYLGDATTAKQVHIGFWESEKGAGDLSRRSILSGLSFKDRQWLVATDGNGESNGRKLIDSTAQGKLNEEMIPSGVNTEAIRRYVKGINARNRYFGSRAEDAGLAIKRADGLFVPFEQLEGQRFPRMMKPEARQAIISQRGPMFEALVKFVMEHNPEVETSWGAKEALTKDFGDADVRRSSSLEFTRKIKHMPDALEVNGRTIAVMQMEPTDVLGHMVDVQAGRLEFARKFGQGVLSNIKDSQIQKLASILGVDHRLGSDAFREQLETVLPKGEVMGMDYKEMRAKMQELGVPLGRTVGQLVDEILGKSPREVGPRQLSQLVEMAEGLGGIKPESGFDANGPVYDAQDLLQKIKQRLTTKVNNNLDVILKQFDAEGGDLKHAEDVLKVAQGLPFHWVGDNSVSRIAKFTSDVIGAIQTPFASIPHFFSSLAQTPQLGGLREYLGAVGQVLGGKEGLHDAMVMATGLTRAELNWRAEPGYNLTRIGQLIRKGMGVATGLDWINEKQKTIAYETFRAKAQAWRDNGIPEWDVVRAKRLGLSPQEIEASNQGKMSDLTFSKIIQEGIGKAQPAYDRSYNKALVESWPLLKGLFAYNTYVFGNTRQNFGIINDLKNAVGSRDSVQIASATTRLMTALAGSVGSGVMIGMLREAIKGQTPQHLDDSYWDTALGALNETAGFGMVHRFSDAFKYNGGVLEKTAFGLMPQVSFLTHVLGSALGYGRFGELPLQERVGQSLLQQAPAARAFNQWIDNIAHPELVGYQEARSAVSRWKRENLPGNATGNQDSPVNPDYWHVFQAVQRGDVDQAREEAIGLIQRKLQDGIDPRDVVDGLRTSLVNRSPLDLSGKNLGLFLVNQASEKRGKFIQAQQSYMRMVNVVAPDLGR